MLNKPLEMMERASLPRLRFNVGVVFRSVPVRGRPVKLGVLEVL